MDNDTLKSLLALKMVHNVGNVTIKNLIAYSGSPAAVFNEKKAHLEKIPGVGKQIARNIGQLTKSDMERIDAELTFIEKHEIQPLYYLKQNFPDRLKDLDDGPVLLFSKGQIDLNRSRMLAVVGTRRATEYGKYICGKIVEGLNPYDPAIVSGLAYGIDQVGHSAALKHGLPTIGILAHGLDRVYPEQHRAMAVKMLDNGGLLTEYPSGVNPDAGNFPDRNRIVAGLVDGVLVVESGEKGGALITAKLAFEYNRDVMAVPGRANDERSKGPNYLIKNNMGFLVENAEDLAYHLGWEPITNTAQKDQNDEQKLRELATDEELKVMDMLKGGQKMHLEALSQHLSLEVSELSVMLFNMELKGLIKTLPGNHYQGMT